jgi:outer membrane protein assembly factor BamB
LWDNPNLDVDNAGVAVFMYAKLSIGSRRVVKFDAATGAVLWSLPTEGHVADYDTYAFGGNFFRLVSSSDEQSVYVEKFSTQRENRSPSWTVAVPCADMSAILLVGGETATPTVAVFGLNAGEVWGLAKAGEELLWCVRDLEGLSTGLIVSKGTALLFGYGGGLFARLAI